jgi:predicted CXXCH cytochrome family protein
VDLNGFVLVTGVTGSDVQYNLPVPHALLPGEFVPYLPDQMTALPFDYERFRRVTTGPRTLTESDGLREGNREGIEGTWAEDGVQCEACHGPGSAHVANPSAGLIDVGSSPELCAACHADPDNPLVIPAKDDFIAGAHQYAEVQASPHAGFACTTCHDPHASSTYDRDRGIRNDCMACHGDQSMALHEGLTFVWDDYTEEITCESCHMPFAAQTGAASRFIVAGETVARIGDTRSHIMTIDTDYDDPLEMFTADGSEVLRDEQGRASVTACFACVRCHHGLGNAFRFPPSQVCPSGEGIHEQQGTP